MKFFTRNHWVLIMIFFLFLSLIACYPKDWWQPSIGLTWQWQLTGKLDLDLQTDVIDIDLSTGQSVVDHYHDKGTKVICYISVGSYENWCSDADQFPDEVLGNEYEGWSGEKWLDIRRIDLLERYRFSADLRRPTQVCIMAG
jgi:hypothetical protein